jgi:ribosomal protein S18 acetylase RimI-like enzyme
MRTRPATRADAETVAELIIADDIAAMGEPDYSLEDLLAEWDEHGFDLAADSLIVEDDDGTIIGCAHFRPGDLVAVVDARREGEGAGTAILEWAYRRAPERGEDRLRQGIGANAASARALLERHGFEVVRSYHRLERDVSADDVEPPGLRPLRADDAHAVFALYEAAFSTRPDYTPRAEDAWIHREFGSPNLDYELSRMIDGKGFTLTRCRPGEPPYVELLGVHPAHGGQGLGTKLLQATFAAAHRRGFAQVVLNVASDNPSALHLYERVGMTASWRIDDYQKALPH